LKKIRPFAILPICLLLTLNFGGFYGYAQVEQPKFTSITSMNRLSSNTVNAILRDSYGWLWFATDDGLNKFDGSEFTVYRHNKSDTTSLRTNDISSLFQDKKGTIWVGTVTGSLHRYNRRKDAFLRVSSRHTINAICEDDRGNLWAGTTQGLVSIDPQTLKIKTLSKSTGIPAPVAEKHVHRLFVDSKKRMWVGTSNGLFRFERQQKRFAAVRHQGSTPTSTGNNFITAMAEDSLGHLWVGTQDGLFMLTMEGELLKKFVYQHSDAQSISNKMIFAIAVVNRDKIWVGTDGGLNVVDIPSGQITRHLPDPRRPFSLTNKSIRSILIDHSGIYWLGTYKGGINKYDKNLTIFGLKRCDPYDVYGLSAPFVTAFAEKPDGDIFVGTDGGGLNLYHRKTNLFTKYTINPKNKSASSGLAILSLALTGPNTLWIGTFQDGLFRFDPSTGRYRQYTQGPDSSSLSNSDIFCLRQDRKGKLWIGTNGGGVNVLNPKTGKFEKYHNADVALPKRIIPLNAYIRDIVEDRHGKFWIASHGTGIAVFDPEKRSSIALNRENSDLPCNNALSILEDRDGNMWVGTGGEGLALYNPQTRKFSAFGAREGLPSGIVNKVLEDAQGRIWVSTNEGISSFDRHTKRFTNYSVYNGLQNNTFVLGAGLRAWDNTLFFGGIEGFNYLDTQSLKRNRSAIPVVLKNLKVGNRTISSADSNTIDADISVAKSIWLDYKQNFSIGYAALNYTNPKQTLYRYRLTGFENEWQQAGPGNMAAYTNLSPGEYRFEVQASNNDTDWGPNTASVAVIIRPPFYLTIYAYIFYILAPIIAVFLMRRRGIRKLHRKFREEQEKQETERARQLDKMKIKFLTNISHEFRTPISLILAPVENLLAQSPSTESKTKMIAIRRNAKRLLNLVDQLLDFRNLQNQELTLELQRNDIIAHIHDTCDSFTELSQRKGIRFTLDIKIPQLVIDFDANKMERILFNLLSNAFKFTPKGGEVNVEVSSPADQRQQHWLHIRISDSGIGIPAEDREKIFERFFQGDTDSSVLNQGSGIGLSIAKEFVQMHNGLISVESEPGRGSTFCINLPCQPYAPAQVDVAEPACCVPIPEPGVIANEPQAPPKHLDEAPKVLLVEDNEEFRHYLKENLEMHYKVLEAGNGKEGWQKALAHHPEIIISDIAMPEMDGIALSQKLKSDKRTSHIPIILLTASTGEEQQLKGLSSGANDYLTKPFNFEILNVKVNNLLLLNRLLKDAYSRQIRFSGPEAQIESADVKLIKDILAYIDQNLNSTQLSVENLAKHVGMSRGTLYTRVLEISGQTPIEFIRSIKLEKAALLLEKSDLNVSQISYSAGFTTPNYFTKSFKAKFNMLPSEYMALKRKPVAILASASDEI
jgi:signal transduction histidine kinase/ligand-binding sensor domain-containing protein/DNA-binding response OmpR family regulator